MICIWRGKTVFLTKSRMTLVTNVSSLMRTKEKPSCFWELGVCLQKALRCRCTLLLVRCRYTCTRLQNIREVIGHGCDCKQILMVSASGFAHCEMAHISWRVHFDIMHVVNFTPLSVLQSCASDNNLARPPQISLPQQPGIATATWKPRLWDPDTARSRGRDKAACSPWVGTCLHCWGGDVLHQPRGEDNELVSPFIACVATVFHPSVSRLVSCFHCLVHIIAVLLALPLWWWAAVQPVVGW